MSKAYLTIDDGPTKNTRKYIDFLISKNIIPMMSFYGENILKSREEGIYAIQKGAIIANHSFSHKHFSKLSLDEAIYEIERNEKLINSLYEEAGVKREYKLMRFPFGDKGGDNKDKLQAYLKKNGFSRIDDFKIKYDWYKENNLNKDYDVFWTFDFTEYKLESNNDLEYKDIIERVNDFNPKEGGTLIGNEDLYNIVLIHDHERTEEICHDYFENLINYALDCRVEFIKPKFVPQKK